MDIHDLLFTYDMHLMRLFIVYKLFLLMRALRGHRLGYRLG